MKFVPIDPVGKTPDQIMAECAEGINAIHCCIHAFQAENQTAHQAAAQKREEMSNDIVSLTTSVEALADKVGALTVDRDMDQGRLKRISELLGAEDSSSKKKPIGLWSMRNASIAGVFVILTALVTHAAVYGLLRQLLITTDHYLVERSKPSTPSK